MNMPAPKTDGAASELPAVTTDQTADAGAKTTPDDTALVQTLQRFLRDQGEAYSEAAIRDLPAEPGESFTPAEMVSVLREIGQVASFGEIPAKTLSQNHCPLLGFWKDGSPFILTDVKPDGSFRVADVANGFKVKKMAAEAFTAKYSGHLILTQRAKNAEPQSSKRWFLSAFAQGKWLYAQVILAATMSNFLGVSTSLFVMVVYDRVVPNEAIESLIALSIGVMIALGFDFITKSLRANFIDRASKRADGRMSRMVFDKILTLRLDTGNQNSGAVASVVREFDTLREFFTSATLVAIVDLPFIFFFIYIVYLIGGNIAIVPLLAVPCVLLIGLAIQPILARLASGAMTTGMSKQAVLVETLNGLETIQATGAGRLMKNRFEVATLDQSELGLKSRIFSQFAINSAASIQQIAQVATIFYGVFLIQAQQLTMGGLIAAVILGGRALGPLGQVASALSRANSARQAFRSIDALMKRTDGVDKSDQRLSRPVLRGEIEFKNVSYTFPGAKTPLIKDLSIKIPAGEKLAVLGRMGSGKSTFAKLCAGLIQPTEGSILMDGIDLRQIDKSDLQRNLGVMLQEAWLFSGTVRENIQLGYYEYDDAHLLKVCQLSGTDDFIKGNPAGYDLKIKERGVGLSGGQRQSINLSRALLHEPNVLVLDEPTSSMDSSTEAAVLERLSGYLQNRTMIAVTHRNTLLKLVTRVLVMDQGKIIVDAPPEQLK
ncbi:type I secretion system permease/ATPase [uncultured Lentibacter sp.]|jgi:ATP-binding cassette subfamily C protein LapB|uniref:type I secretion system permease/ATPase n=1 Tax=uncultured Lentibacter sp. TaxID=1659309 RepID=UPI002631F2D5|nr:type I secretion system permease/ATPase [uncultured Lentibacter sp.]